METRYENKISFEITITIMETRYENKISFEIFSESQMEFILSPKPPPHGTCLCELLTRPRAIDTR